MNDALFVRGFDRLSDLPGDAQRFVERQRTAAELVRERRPVDEFEDQRCAGWRVGEAVDGGDVGVVQRGHDPRFALQALQANGVADEPFRQHLQCDIAIKRTVVGAKHFTHAAFAELGDDRVRSNPIAEGIFHPNQAPF